ANPGLTGDSGEVTVLLGNGNGTFQAPRYIPVPGAPDALVDGDFNGDGRLDLAVAAQGTNQVTVLLGNGDGTFKSSGSFAAGPDPISLVAGDFTGDGRLDLAIADYTGNEVRVLKNQPEAGSSSSSQVDFVPIGHPYVLPHPAL